MNSIVNNNFESVIDNYKQKVSELDLNTKKKYFNMNITQKQKINIKS